MAWVITFLERGWKVQWMKWPKFCDAVLNKNFEVCKDFSDILVALTPKIQFFKDYKFIAGGFNLATNYM